MKAYKLKLIGLTGPNGAGKGEAAKYFIKKSYEYFSLSDEIREELKKSGLEINRNNLIEKGNELREKFGSDILAKRVMKRIKDKAVIDSIRNPEEIRYFRKQGGFILICIDAPLLLRFQRIMKRGRRESVSSLYEFIKKEQEEMGDRENAQQLLTCMKMADFTIINDGTINELHKKLEEIIKYFQ
ncbi:AAA family ATPase [Candidatus Aminicenantes bacterium AH-873-B07]|jgi:dephospho-CoA kinase|nr:AAA family ATPase [Candidatus Aminicenantes bacterium AH-873-B07]